MPRNHSKRLFNRTRGRDNKPQKVDDRNTPKGYPITIKQNEDFEKYYKMQNIVPEEDWDLFMNTLRRKLPTTLRITSHGGQAADMLRMMKQDYFLNLIIPREIPDDNEENTSTPPATKGEVKVEVSDNVARGTDHKEVTNEGETKNGVTDGTDKGEGDAKINGEVMTDKMIRKMKYANPMDDPHKPLTYEPEAPKPLPWYPDELAWQLDFDRRALKHSVSLKKLHSFLITETESGNISRQEAVSMIPPLVMDIKSHHKILDMCAAPGSKTGQLIEMLHKDCDSTMPKGIVVANDFDNKRCYLMVHQVKRLETSNYLITNHDASGMPSFNLNKEGEPRKMMKFDRILADVPCSGDGTIRKNPDIWKRWNCNGGICQHITQRSILGRGLELLEVGGRLVYSTCSFNPIENEAVISTMLSRCKGSVELIDISQEIPGLKYMQGLKKWKVMSKSGVICDSYDTIEDNDLKSHIRPTMFCPDAETADAQNLQRCIRILPHYQNTGAFFVAALRKTKELPWIKVGVRQDNEEISKVAREEQAEVAVLAAAVTKEEEEADKVEGDEPMQTGATTDPSVTYDRKRKRGGVKERARQNKKVKLRGYTEDPFVFLPRSDAMFDPIMKFYGMKDDQFDPTNLMIRCATSKRRHLYLTSDLVKCIVENNEGRVRFVNMGLKVLSRSESKYCECDFRLAQDGIGTMYPFMASRHVTITVKDIIIILTQDNPFLSQISPETRVQLERLAQGSVIFVYTPKQGETPACKMVICGWLGQTSTRSFLDKFERAHYLRLCGVETSEKTDLKKSEVNYLNTRHDNASDTESKNVTELDTKKDNVTELDTKKDNFIDTETKIDNITDTETKITST